MGWQDFLVPASQLPKAGTAARPAAPPEAPADAEPEPEQEPRSGKRDRSARAPATPANPVEAAKQICLRLLSERPRTRAELAKKLTAKQVDAEIIEQVLGRLDEVGLIDDAAFAEMWVSSRHRYQGMARRALVAELRRRGVDGAVAQEAAAAVDGDAERERARELVRKRLRAMSGLDEATSIRRLVGVLARKGYPEGLAYRVVREELHAAGSETDLLDGPLAE